MHNFKFSLFMMNLLLLLISMTLVHVISLTYFLNILYNLSHGNLKFYARIGIARVLYKSIYIYIYISKSWRVIFIITTLLLSYISNHIIILLIKKLFYFHSFSISVLKFSASTSITPMTLYLHCFQLPK